MLFATIYEDMEQFDDSRVNIAFSCQQIFVLSEVSACGNATHLADVEHQDNVRLDSDVKWTTRCHSCV